MKDFEDAIYDSIKAVKEIQKSNIANISTRAVKNGITNVGYQKLIRLEPE